MPVTINANGLSIVHKGSDGEATASVPDVCLTTRGKSTDPIPYGNNAKSSDLIDGSTTVFADGGNSIALKGSKFSKSTGDSGGDKKGVTSGTIEGEAEFITSSPTVIIEGKGVARLSDQMTMNNGNTMCFGVQNPSLTVDESLEVPCNINICVRHPNGHRLINADYELTDENGAPLGSGTLGSDGRGVVSDLKPDKIKLNAKESNDDFVISPQRQANPHYVESLSDDAFFDIASKGKQAFWKPTRIQTGLTPWGSIGQCLSSDKYFQDIVKTETQLHFSHSHPKAVYSFDKVSDAIIGNIDNQLPHTTETLLAYSIPMELEEGDMLSVLLRLAPYETTDRMLAYMRAQGKGNPQSYLGNYDWAAAKKTVNQDIELLLNKINARLEFLRDEASKLQYAYLSEEVFDKHIDTLSTYIKKLPDLISGVFNKMENKAAALLANTSNVNVIKAADSTYSAEAGVIEAVINTTQTIDTVEPYMNEVAGTISNVMPIYPVRYGYANFFGELMPAQAPPVISDMQNATGLKETGGYLLRLLREGWIYIKEEGDKDQFHIFKYAQTETATGVIEKFEKYYFTNEENAQDGLTLDTSSGATFYPFAFVTANTKEISIAYSEHEWSATIIDKMNGDEDLRKKSMQRIDLSNTSTDFSVEANQDHLNALVEDYRTNDEKWLTDKDASKPSEQGYDANTASKSYHLSSEGIVKTIQKSHSEKKDGILVALFDPVGRQIDLAYALSLNIADEQAYVANNLYPLTIGNFAQACLDSKEPAIQKAAEENLATEALSKYQEDTIEKQKLKQKERQRLLALMDAFMAGDYATDEIGSLTTYLTYYFESDEEGVLEPEREVSTLLNLTADLLGGITASEEGNKYMDDWIGQAFSSDQNNVASGIPFKVAQILFTQCQSALPWDEAPTKLTLTLGPWLAKLHTEVMYGVESSVHETRLSANKGLSQFAKEVLPEMIELLYGVEYTGGKVQLTIEEFEKLVQDLAKTSHVNIDPNQYSKGKLKFGKKLYEWSEDIAKNATTRFIELNEVRITKLAPIEIQKIAETAPVKTTLHLAGFALNNGFAAWSFWANVDSIQKVLAQTNFDNADPLNDGGHLYQMTKLTGYMTAISTDTATLAHSALKVTNKTLPKISGKLAAQIRPNLAVYEQRLGAELAKNSIRNLVVAANVAVVLTSAYSGVQSWNSGNKGAAIGNGMIAGASIYFILAAFSIVSGGIVPIALAFTTLIAGTLISDHYTKQPFENLLYSCFWGTSEIYPFWDAFADSASLTNANDRKDYYLDDKNRGLSRYFETAFRIESQEFLNYFYMPKLSIIDRSITPYNGPSKTMLTYTFILPDFKMNVSELFGSVYTNQESSYPIMATPKPNDAATQAFSSALTKALERVTNEDFKKDGLHLTVDVEFEQPVTLFWRYQPSDGMVVPQRALSGNSIVGTKYIGMKDDRPNDTAWGR